MFWLINKALAAAVTASTTINPNLPGPYSVASKGPVAIIANIYYFALAGSGLLAFGVIVYAGIKWTASRGNTGDINDAKDMIQSALWGLVLLASAFVLMNTINPELAIMRIPELSPLPVSSSTVGGSLNPNCSDENPTGACAISFDECKKDNTNHYRCLPKDNLIFVCRAPSGDVRYCSRPGATGGGPSGGARCSSNCSALTGGLVTACTPEQNTGQCRTGINQE